MNHAARKPMTANECLDWEVNGFAPVAIVGGTVEHATFGASIYQHLSVLAAHAARLALGAVNGELKI